MGAEAPTIVFIPVHCIPRRPLVPSVANWAKENGHVPVRYARSPSRRWSTLRSPMAGTQPSANAARRSETLPRACSPRPITTTRSGIWLGSPHQRRDEHRADLGVVRASSGWNFPRGSSTTCSAIGPKNSIGPNIAAKFWNISAAPSVGSNSAWATSHCFWLLIR